MGKKILKILLSLLEKPKELLEQEIRLRREISCNHTHPTYPNILIGHTVFIACSYVEGLNEEVGGLWEQLTQRYPQFSKHKNRCVWINLIRDRLSSEAGFQERIKVLVNIAQAKDELDLTDTLCEELHHFLQWVEKGKRPIPIQSKVLYLKSDIEGVPYEVLYYSLNEHEYQAGKAALEIVGSHWRQRLFDKVERYRINRNIS